MSYHRACGGKDDGKPSNTESQKRVERKLHNFFFFFFFFIIQKTIFGCLFGV